MEENIIVLEDADGNQIEFAVLDVYQLDGETYFALIEADQIETGEEVLIMRVEGEGDDAELVTIESDAELEAAFNEFLARDEADDCECDDEDCHCHD